MFIFKKIVVGQNKNPKSHTLRYVLGVSMMMKMIFLSLCYFSTLGEPTRFTCCEEAKITVWNKNIYIYIYSSLLIYRVRREKGLQQLFFLFLDGVLGIDWFHHRFSPLNCV